MAQFALFGMDDEHLKEAAWVVSVVTGLSAFAYGIDYGVERQKQDVKAMVEHMKESAQG